MASEVADLRENTISCGHCQQLGIHTAHCRIWKLGNYSKATLQVGDGTWWVNGFKLSQQAVRVLTLAHFLLKILCK